MRAFDWRKRLQTRQDELFSRQEELTALFSRLETEWLDVRDQVRRSYQRLEKVAQRANPHPPPPAPTAEDFQAVEARLDPYSRKLLEVRRSQNDDAPGIDEGAG